MSRKMTGIVKTFDRKSGKGFIIPSDGRKEVQIHISAFTPRDAEVLIPGLRVEFCRVMACEDQQRQMFISLNMTLLV